MPEIKVDPQFKWVLTKRSFGVGRNGYAQASFKDKTKALHRIVWALANKCKYNEVPWLDHINRDRLDNRIANLRPASPCLNANNRSRNSGSVVKRRGGRHEASVNFRRKNHYIGSYSDSEQARAACLGVKTVLCIVESALCGLTNAR